MRGLPHEHCRLGGCSGCRQPRAARPPPSGLGVALCQPARLRSGGEGGEGSKGSAAPVRPCVALLCSMLWFWFVFGGPAVRCCSCLGKMAMSAPGALFVDAMRVAHWQRPH